MVSALVPTVKDMTAMVSMNDMTLCRLVLGADIFNHERHVKLILISLKLHKSYILHICW